MAIHIDGYVVDGEIGRGGFGVVYLATQTAFNRPVAIKVLHSGLSADDVRKQFARECRAIGSLRRHPNILTVYSTGTTTDGDPYLAMALLTGGALSQRVPLTAAAVAALGVRLAMALLTGGALSQRVPLTPAAVAALGVRLATGLQVAHDGGVIHRDVKPSNVLFDDNDEPVLVDFGISSLAGEASTTSNNIAVSIGYTSPEILDGARPSPATDIYGLGATLFASVTGRTPFVTEGSFSSIAILASRILSQPIEDLRPLGVPDELCRVIETAMAKEPAERYPSMAAMRAALEPIADETTVRAPREMWGAGSVAAPLLAASASAATTAPSRASATATRRRERVVSAMRMHRAISVASAVAFVAAVSVGGAALAAYTDTPERGNGAGARGGVGTSPSSTTVASPSRSTSNSAVRSGTLRAGAKPSRLVTRTTTNAAGQTVTAIVPAAAAPPVGGLGGIVAGGRPKTVHHAAPAASQPLTLSVASKSSTERDSVNTYLKSSYSSGVRVLSGLPKGLQSSANHIYGTIAADAVSLTSSYRNIRSKTFTIAVRVTDNKNRTVTKSFTWTIRDQYIPVAYVGRYGDGKDGAPNLSDLYSFHTYGNPNVGVCTTQQQYDAADGAIWHQSLPKDAPFEWGKRTGSLRIYYLANPASDAGCVSGVSRGYG